MLVGPSPALSAQVQTDKPTENRIEISGFSRHFSYEETSDTGERLNREDGWTPGVSLEYSRALTSGSEMRVAAWATSGRVDYRGTTNLGNPFETETEGAWRGVSAGLVSPLSFFSEDWPETRVFLSIDWYQWQRDIQPVGRIGGLNERYRWHTLQLGAEGKVWQRERVALLLEAAVYRVVSPYLAVDMTRRHWGYPKLKMKDRNGGKLGVRAEWTHSPSIRFYAAMRGDAWSFGASPVREIRASLVPARIREPESETRIWQIELGIAGRF